MASFDAGGIAAVMEKFDGMAKGSDEACSAAVKAGGKLLAQRLADAAPVRTGALRDSIKAGKVEYNAGDGYHCRVAPAGESHGQNLAMIGNVLEYGRSNMPPHPWFNPTVARSADEVRGAMRDAFNEKQKEAGR